MLVESFSGIRGIYNKGLTENIARKYAYVFHEFLKKRSKKEPVVVIGTDTRPSCRSLKKAMSDCFEKIIDAGIMPTPAVEFAVRHYKADGGIIITASHNEPEWNGFKFLDKDGAIVRKKDSEKIINSFRDIKGMGKKELVKKLIKKGYRKAV